ncbi:MAG: hypothetical protein WC736_15685 [Gallionella sp.]
MTEWILAGLGVLVGVIGWLLAKRDDKRQEEIAASAAAVEKLRTEHQSEIHELFRLRAQDVQALAEYKLKIAENHYPKNELDSRFAQLNQTMEKGFNSLGEEVKAMTHAIVEHVNKSH